MAECKYIIVHIPGEENVWADILSRWGSVGNQLESYPKILALFYAPFFVEDIKEFEWPSKTKIKIAQ